MSLTLDTALDMLELAHAEIRRLKAQVAPSSKGSGSQRMLPYTDVLRHEAMQSYAAMRDAAHSLKDRAPDKAKNLEMRAEKLKGAL